MNNVRQLIEPEDDLMTALEAYEILHHMDVEAQLEARFALERNPNYTPKVIWHA